MTPNDDQTWMDALAGRDTPVSATRREAQVLRTALSHASETPMDLASDSLFAPRRERALIERAVNEGLIEPKRRRPRWPLPLAASVLLMLAAGLVLQQQNLIRTSDAVRGDERGIVHLTAADPARLARDLLAQLRTAGVQATGYEALGVQGIDADLTLPLTPEVQRVLEAHEIPVPADGVLRIEIRSPD